jgi:hypothetical protein
LGLFVGAFGVVALAQLLPVSIMVGVLITGGIMMMAAAAILIRVLYDDWKDPVPARESQAISAKQIREVSNLVKFPFDKEVTHGCSLVIGTKDESDIELTLAVSEQAIDDLLREATAEQAQVRFPTRADAPGRNYAPLPQP